MISLQQFYEQFQVEVRTRSLGDVADPEADGRPPDFKENSFTELVLEYLAEKGIADGAAVCYCAAKTTRGNIKLNAWAVDDEEGVVTLCVSLYHGKSDPVHLTQTAVGLVLDQAARAFEQAVAGLHESMEPSYEASRMMRLLYEAREDIATVDVILLTDGALPVELNSRRDRKGPYSFRYDCWDLQRLYRLVVSDLPYESIVINLEERFGAPIPCLPPGKREHDHAVYLAVFPGRVLSELYDEFGPRLLDLNVRSFLQARGKVNRGIRDTLCTEPGRFFAYNNGISVTAEHVEVVRDENGTPAIRSLTGFQVVNGGQTVASIHRAEKLDKADTSGVFVQAKITEVPSDRIDSLAPLISRYANSQNRVSDADFSSNDPFNVELQRLSERIWAPGEQNRWFYERTRGQYQVERFREGSTAAKMRQFELRCPSTQRFTKTDMAKYLNCWNGRPHIVSLGAQKNFVLFMDDLRESYSKDWQPDEAYYKELIAKAILFRTADRAAREAGIQAYKVNVVAYMVALLSEKSLGRLDLMDIWNRQTPPQCVTEAFRQWAQPVYDVIVRSAGQRNVTEWCKREGCWREVRAAGIEAPPALQAELARHQPVPTVGLNGGRGGGRLSAEDQDNIARTMQVDAATWFHLSEWGRRKKKLKDWQCGIALSLAGYAQGDWEKVPSAKQARQAVRILQIAEEEGALEMP